MGQEEVPFTANDIKLAFDPSARFQAQPVYQDKPFTIAFILHWLLFFGLFIFACVYYSTLPSNVNINEVDAWQQFILRLTAGDIFGCLGVLAGCAVIGGIFSVFWLWLMKRFPRFMITLSLFACCILCVVVGAIFMIIGATVDDGIPAIVVGGVFVALGLILGLCYFFWRKKIPFTVLVLSTVMHILDYQSGNFLVAIGAVVLYFVWFILWAAACIVAQSFSYMNEAVAAVILTYFLFCFIWTTEVIKNVVHVTVSGAVASWYFKSDADGAQATKNALVRATTTSFGSICFGSLLVAIVTTLRAIAESKSTSNDSILIVLLRCIIKCFLICIESLLRLFNKYVFVQVAVYGKSYIQAAKSTWTLISYYGIETIINDTLIGNVTGLGILAGTMVTLIPAIGFPYIFDNSDPTLVFLQFFLGLLVGIGIVSVCLNVVDSACAAFFVCICEEPATLQRNFPELHAYMQQTYAQSNLFTVVHM